MPALPPFDKVISMEFYQLKSFLAVARCGSLSSAAITRNISLPGISKHIKMLEEHFGYPLFTRTPKGMELTENGQQALHYAERIQREIDNLAALSRKSAPVFRIGFNIAPEFIELLHLKDLLEQHHPNHAISLTNQNSHELLEGLSRDELDLCLAFGEIPAHFHKLVIRRVRMPLMIPVSLESDPADLSQACWIINAANCPFKAPLEEFWSSHGIQPRSTILAQDLSRRELVAQGLGIGFLEPQDGLALIKKGQAKPHDQFFLEVPLWVVYQDQALHADAEHLQRYVQQRYEGLQPFTGSNCAN